MLYNKKIIIEAANSLKETGIPKVDIVVVLGSGLSSIVDQYKDAISIPYSQIPHMGSSTVKGHASRFVYIQRGGKHIVLMQGRLHMYEGYTAFESALGIAMMGELGARVALLTNAAGAINDELNPGDIMLIEDHIKMQTNSPLEGVEDNSRFVDMQNAYDTSLHVHLHRNFGVKRGVYLSTLGPQYETPAEIQFFNQMGADAVGMSTVMETIMARYYRMRVLGFSLITNKAAGIFGAILQHNDVVEQANKAGKLLGEILDHLYVCTTANL